jgi:protein-L-isoaspartate(D-aspartate) O-methyltransferase
MPPTSNPPEKMMFQLNLRRRGISDQAVLHAMDDIPRDLFVAAADRADAWRDSALGIACGQTISQPFVVAYMTEQLQLQNITACSRSVPAPVTRRQSCRG